VRSTLTCTQLALRLFGLVRRLHNGLRTLLMLCDSGLVPKLIDTPAKCPESPIFALFTPFPRDLAQYCHKFGFVVRAVVHPTVPEGTERVRICLHAGNSEEQVDHFLEAIERWIESKKGEPSTQSQTMIVAKL
jgi:8-amino-7-oxononanoate synthase